MDLSKKQYQKMVGNKPAKKQVHHSLATVMAKKMKKEYPYLYFHATPYHKEIRKSGFRGDTYAWEKHKQARDYAKSQGKGWKVVPVKSKQKLPVTERNYTDEEKMDNGDLWLLKKNNIK